MNEGDNFGTAKGGAGQQGGGINRSRYFGARSRSAARGQIAMQQTNFTAAQNIAANPNTPKFFSDAVIANSAPPVEAPRKRKLPLFIGIGAGIILLVVAIVAVVMMKTNSDGNGSDGGTVMEATFNSTDVNNIYEMEALYQDMIMGVLYSSDFATEDFHNRIKNGTTAYKNVLAAIKNKEKQLKKEDEDAKIDVIISKMEKNVGIFEENYTQYDLLYSALENMGDDTLNEISDESIKELAKNYYEHYVSYVKNRDNFRETGCKDFKTPLSSSQQQLCNSYEDQLSKDYRAMRSSTLMKDLFIGDDAQTIRDNCVRDLIAEIYLKIKNSGVENEDEN